jgi:hypothetical protein
MLARMKKKKRKERTEKKRSSRRDRGGTACSEAPGQSYHRSCSCSAPILLGTLPTPPPLRKANPTR